jgi:hypothetical protein
MSDCELDNIKSKIYYPNFYAGKLIFLIMEKCYFYRINKGYYAKTIPFPAHLLSAVFFGC